MAVRKILRAGEPLLRKKSADIPTNEIGSKEIKKLIRDMFDTLVVVGFDRSDRYPDAPGMERKILINPEIEKLEEASEGSWEGCLSVPGMRGYVERPRKIRMKWYDENEDFHDEVIEGYDAVVFQHECDHLEGVLYVDRLKDPRLFGFNEELENPAT